MWKLGAAVLALILITIFAPTGVAVAAWTIAALLLLGAGLGASPSIRLRGRVNRLDSGAGPPRRER
jgi:hypothetical protein